MPELGYYADNFYEDNKKIMKKEDLRIVYMGTPDFAVEALRQLAEDHAPAGDTFTWLMIWLAEAQRDGLIAQYPDGRYGPHPALRTAV